MGQGQPKYHVTDDGKVFVINEDGTTTKYGRIVSEKEEVRHPRKPIPCIVWWIVAIILIAGGVALFILVGEYNGFYTPSYHKDAYCNSVAVSFLGCLRPLGCFCIGLMLLVLILIGCVIRLNNKMRAIK